MALECKLISYDNETCRLVGEIVNVCADNRILDEKTIREKINYWKNNAKPGAAEYKDNGDVVNLFLGGNKAVIDWKKTSVSLNKKIKRWILSILFKQMRLKNKNN